MSQPNIPSKPKYFVSFVRNSFSDFKTVSFENEIIEVHPLKAFPNGKRTISTGRRNGDVLETLLNWQIVD